MSHCTQARSTGEGPVDRLLNGGLSPEELAEVTTHIESCADCAEKKQILETARSAWMDRQDPALPVALRNRIEDRLFAAIEAEEKTLEVHSNRTNREYPKWRRTVLSAAAVAATVLIASYVTMNSFEDTEVAPTATHSPDRTSNNSADQTGPKATLSAIVMDISGGQASYERPGEYVKPVVQEQVLGPGETLTLGKGAAVRFAMEDFAVVVLGDGAIAELVSQDGSQGIALKRGSAALKVNSDKLDDLFKVVTPAGDVEVNGTVFYVSVSAAAQLTVAVVESAVTIRDSANPRNVIPVRSGQAIDVDWSDLKVSPMERELEAKIHHMLSLTAQTPPDTGENENTTDKRGSLAKDSRQNRMAAEELFAQATLARKSGRVQEAADLYQRILQSSPRSELRAEAAFNLGQLYFNASNFEAAEKALSANRVILERSSFQEMSLFYLAKTRCRLGKTSEAEEVFDRFRRRFPNHPLTDSMRELEENCRK